MTELEKMLLEALQKIADDSPEHVEGYRDEWTEAAGYSRVQAIAREAMAKAEGY